MLTAKNRLKKNSEFVNVFKAGKYAAGDGIAIKYVRSSEEKPVRIGFAIGLGYSKKATERNRLRRTLRAAAAPLIPKLTKGIEIVIMPTKENKKLEKIKSGETQEALERIFLKAGLLNQDINTKK